MTEVRIARPNEIGPQKEIWKKCFGDDEVYINFYFENRYKDRETALGLVDGQVVSMLTMITARLIFPDRSGVPTSMFYAIATHPDFRGRRMASKVMSFADDLLIQHGIPMSLLVPADEKLFDFYEDRGYQERFYAREATLTSEQIRNFAISDEYECAFNHIDAHTYNSLRAGLLTDRLYVDYTDEDIAYQKHLSCNSGGDLYWLQMGEDVGCAAVERLSPDRVFVKELLAPERVLHEGLHTIARILPAQEYFVRLPAFMGAHFGGDIRCLGMIKTYFPAYTYTITGQLGYLGICFD